MTEFTSEWIAKARNACILFGEPATTEFRKALDEIERLQKYKEKLISDATQNEFVLLAYHDSLKEMKARVQELEQERDYLDGRCAALENDLVLDDVVSKLENVQTRLADFENMARAFVEYKAPDHICRMHFDLMLKESEE